MDAAEPTEAESATPSAALVSAIFDVVTRAAGRPVHRFLFLLNGHTDAYVVENFLRDGRFVIQFAIMAVAVDIIADEPAHGGARHYVTGEMLTRADPCHHYRGSESIGNYWNNQRMWILVGHHRSQRPCTDCVSRRKAGAPPPVWAVLKTAFAAGFEWPCAVADDFEGFHDYGAVDQGLKTDKTGFSEPVVVAACPDEVKPGAHWYQGVRRAKARPPRADRHLGLRVGKRIHSMLVMGNEDPGSDAHNRPPFRILLGG